MSSRLDPLRVLESERPRWTWTTTFHLDIPFLDDHLLRRLGERSELTVLCDAGWLSRHLAESRDDRLGRRAGQDYLLHPVAQGRLFHPKTYLFARPDGGVLLVGSGNLDLSGLARGRELFVAFRSDEEGHRSSLAAWAHWMNDLVKASEDALLLERFSELRARCPWLVAPHRDGAFVDNRVRALLEVFAEQLRGPVRELHLTSPFLDATGTTVARIIRRLRPGQTTLYLCRAASVNGEALRATLSRVGLPVTILRYGETPFVHAKAVGAVTESGALVLSGSANLSAGALLRSWADDPGANVEAGCISLVSSEALREIFAPAFLPVEPYPDEELDSLTVREDDSEQPMPIVLSAAVLDRGTIELRPEPPSSPDSEQLHLRTAAGIVPVEGAAARAPEGLSGGLVWLVRHPGDEIVSNVLPLTVPAALEQRSREAGTKRAAPPGLSEEDISTPYGRILAWLAERYVPAPADTGLEQHAAQSLSTGEDAIEAEADEEFWRLLREHASVDPRSARYGRRWSATDESYDAEMHMFRIWLDLVPASEDEPRRGENVPLLVSAPEQPTLSVGGWTSDRKRAERFCHVIERWGAALADPRLTLFHPLAPAENMAALCQAIWLLWEIPDTTLSEIRRDRLFGICLGAFAEWLRGLPEDEREAVRDALPLEARSVLATLLFLALHDGAPDRDERLLAWQDDVVVLLEADLPVFDSFATELLGKVGFVVSPTHAGESVFAAALRNDPAWWCRRLARRLNLTGVHLTRSGLKHRPWTLRLRGCPTQTDPRILRAVVEARDRVAGEGLVVDLENRRIASFGPAGELSFQREGHRTLSRVGSISEDLLRGAAADGMRLDDLATLATEDISGTALHSAPEPGMS